MPWHHASNTYENKSFFHLILTAFFASLFIVGCDSTEEGPPSWEEARIQPRGVEGIEFGTTMGEVKERLGESMLGGFQSGERGRIALMFADSALHGLRLFFDETGRDTGLVYDDLPFDLVLISEPYTGKTKEGIEIGSDQSFVESRWGPYSYRVSNRDITGNFMETYCIQQKNFYIQYYDNKISKIYIAEKYPESREEQPCVPQTHPSE